MAKKYKEPLQPRNLLCMPFVAPFLIHMNVCPISPG